MGRYIGLAALMCTVFFCVGVWVGEAYVLSFEQAASYNPLVYYQMMSRLQNSPFMWATPELWYTLRDGKVEFGVGAVASIGAGVAYLFVGPAGALRILTLAAPKSRLAAKAVDKYNDWETGKLESPATSKTKRCIDVDSTNISTNNMCVAVKG